MSNQRSTRNVDTNLGKPWKLRRPHKALQWRQAGRPGSQGPARREVVWVVAVEILQVIVHPGSRAYAKLDPDLPLSCFLSLPNFERGR